MNPAAALAMASLDFVSPWFLGLLALVPLVVWVSLHSLSGLGGPRRILSIGLRSLAVAFAVLALARTRLLLDNDRLCVLFVVDRSDSVPVERRSRILDYIEDVAKRRPSGEDYVGVVVFGKDAGVEQSPRQESLALDDVLTLIDPEATDIQAAIQLAVAAFPEDAGGKRIVLFSDGNENSGHALEEVRNARSLGIQVDVVPIPYEYETELSVEKLIVSPEVNVGQPYSVEAVLHSTAETVVKVRLFKNGALVSDPDATVELRPGKNPVRFPLRGDGSGLQSFELQLEPLRPEDDTVAQNNLATGFTVIEGEPKVLFCAFAPDLDRALLETLAAEQIEVDVRGPESLPRDLEEYIDYSAIVLSNVGAHRLSQELMLLLENLVQGLGVGLVMIGGEESFGAGGYQGTPVERLLPVDMEIKQKKQLPNGALAFVVHSCEIGNGNFWARKVIQQAIRILSPRDYAGVLYYDSSGGERWLFPMTPCSNKQSMFNQLRGFNPGDMPTFQPIMTLAYQGLKATRASVRHMIVLSDGDPSPPDANLMQRITRDERITISTICYGAHGQIPPGMEQMARQGNGTFHYLRSPDQLPEIFIREATTVRKTLISEEPFLPLVGSWGEALRGFGESDFPQLDGHVLTTAKPLASVHLLHPGTDEDPTQDPVFATWTYGLGKTAAFTSDAGRRWGKGWAAWPGYRRFWGQLIRWVAKPKQSELFRVERQIDGGSAEFVIDAFHPDGSFLDGLSFEAKVVGPGPRYETRDVEVRQVGPGRYVPEGIDADARGTHMLRFSTEVDGTPVSFVTGFSVPYSAEYRQLATHHEFLRQIAEAGGGRFVESEEQAAFFSRDFPPISTVQDIWRSLLIAAICLFFADVFIRRVMVEPRAAYRKAAAAVAAALGGRRREAQQGEERLSALLRAKSQVRDRTRARSPVPEREEAPETAPAFDAAFDAGSTAPRAEREREARPVEARAGDRSDERGAGEGESYTSRLLEAKRRALKRDRGD